MKHIFSAHQTLSEDEIDQVSGATRDNTASITTKALGEEGGMMTTMALGEEGGCFITKALGESGGNHYTTLAMGEEGGGFH